MSDFIKKLASENNRVLYKTAIANYLIEYVDKDLRVVARVTAKGHLPVDFELEKLGALYSDDTQQFYSVESGEPMSRGEVHDLAVEAYLASPKTAEPRPHLPTLEHLEHELGESEAEEEEEHHRVDEDEAIDQIVWDLKHKQFLHSGEHHAEGSKKTAALESTTICSCAHPAGEHKLEKDEFMECVVPGCACKCFCVDTPEHEFDERHEASLKKADAPAACHVAPDKCVCEICGEECKPGESRCSICCSMGAH